MAISGIGNPDNFYKSLSNLNMKIVKKFILTDQYHFKKSEILSIVIEAKKNNCEIIMTEKDFFKIKKFNIKNIKYLKISLEIKNKKKFLNKILEIYDKIN